MSRPFPLLLSIALPLCVALPASAQVVATTEVPAALTCGATGLGRVAITANAPAPVASAFADIVFVIDDSGSVAQSDFNDLKIGLRRFVQSLSISVDAFRVGVVQFSTSARLTIPLTDRSASLQNAVMAMAPEGGFSCIGCGIALADQHLQANARPGADRYLIFVGDGRENRQFETLTLEAVALAAQAHATVFAVGVGQPLLAALETIASDIPGRQTVFLADFSTVGELVDDMGWELLQAPPDGDVVITLDANVALAFTGASAPAGTVTFTSRQIQWRLAEVPSGTTELSFAVRQIGAGGVAAPVFDSAAYESGRSSAPPVIPNPMVLLSACGPGGEDPLVLVEQLTADLTACTEVKDAMAVDLATARDEAASLEAEVTTLSGQVADAQVLIGEQLARIASLEAALQASAADAAARGAAMALAVSRVQADLRQTFSDAAFVIPGATVEQQLANLIDAVIALNRGRTQGILDALRGQ